MDTYDGVDTMLDAPASVTLITRPELTALAPTHVMDAIVGTRGFFPNDDLTFASLGVRGFSEFGSYGNRVLMQIDGHTVNDDWLDGSFVGYDLLSDLSVVDRVEVVRGPGSSLYGTGAFFGLVNVDLVRSLPLSAHPMDVVRTAVSVIGATDPTLTAIGPVYTTPSTVNEPVYGPAAGDSYADAKAHCDTLVATTGRTFIHPFDDPQVIAGQGTIALEMLADAPELDMLCIPIGGGGLASGSECSWCRTGCDAWRTTTVDVHRMTAARSSGDPACIGRRPVSRPTSIASPR